MADANDLVKTVIQVLNDGKTGYADIGEHLKDPQIKAFFMKEAQTRGTYAQELAAVSGFSAEDAGGTAIAAMHRTWGDVKAYLGGSDHTLLETAEQGEDAAKKAYATALGDTSLSSSVRALLQQQQTHIVSAHNQINAFRDSTK